MRGNRLHRVALAGGAALSILAFAACGGKSGSPSGGSSPTPAPTAAPTPTPVPTPNLPGTASCSRLPPGVPSGNACTTDGPYFQAEVEAAVADVRARQPEIFEETSGGTVVHSPGRFYVGIIDDLDKHGICAGFDSEELQVATSGGFNDQFSLITSRGYLRFGLSTYRTTCRPAAIPTAHPPFPPGNGCALPPSLELTCTREQSSFYPDVERSIDDVVRTHPEIFDLTVHAPGADWPGVRDFDKYHQYIVQSMIAKGYCSRFDGEEVVAKKGNQFSEHFDVFLGEGFVRRGEGIYRSTCWPAAF